jgi:hypothetical protein
MDIEPTSLFQKVRRYISRQRKISSVSDRETTEDGISSREERKKATTTERKQERKRKIIKRDKRRKSYKTERKN